MATTTLTIGNDLLSTTTHVLMSDWRDALHTKVAFCEAQAAIHGEGQPSQQGGTRILYPVGLNVHSNTTRHQTGFEKIDLSVQDVSVPAVYSWAYVNKPVAISGHEEFINSGESAILSMAETRVKSTANKLRREFCEHMTSGGVASWDDWNTLNGVDNAGGFLEENAVGAQTNSVGGISKTTYSSTVGWQNQVFDGSGSFNANGLNGLYDLDTEVSTLAEESADTVWLGSRSAMKNLKRALQANERYIDMDKIDGGRPAQFWNGVRIHTERYMPDSGTQTATDPISFYRLDPHSIFVLWDPEGYFYNTDWETVSGEYEVRSCRIRCRGQLVANYLGSSGIAFDLETF